MIRILLALALVVSFVSPAPAQTARPSAVDLFPAESVIFLRSADATLLVDRMKETAALRMFEDPEMESIRGALSDVVREWTSEAEEEIGFGLDDATTLIPAGEVAFAVVGRDGQAPALLLLADYGDGADDAQALLDQMAEKAAENDISSTTQQLRNDEATVYRAGNDEKRQIGLVRRENTFVLSSDADLLQVVLDRWDGLPIEPAPATEDGEEDDSEPTAMAFAETLNQNTRFTAALRECLTGRDEPPQLIAFFDPIGMVEAFGGRSTGVRVAMATFPALGLDGIQGIATASWFATDKWDQLHRGHLLLENPRAGVVKIARLGTELADPPAFVPLAVENYFVAKLEPARLYGDIASLYDKFQYDGAFRKNSAEPFKEATGFDLEEDILGGLTGDLHYFSTYPDNGVRLQGMVTLIAGVKDRERASEIVADLLAMEGGPDHEEATFGSQSYYRFIQNQNVPEEFRQPNGAAAIVGDHLVVCQSEEIFKAMVAALDGERPRLADSLQYKMVKSRLSRLMGGKPMSLLAYHDGEVTLRHWYQIAQSEDAKDRLDRISEFIPWMSGIVQLMDEEDLPELETLLKYNAPSGSAIVDTDTGWSMISFTFRAEE